MKYLTPLLLGIFIASPSASAAELGVVRGGPKSLGKSLQRIEQAVAVCFATGRPTAPVKVQVKVAASGRVTSARALVKGAVAQCVAGVLAVHSLSRARRGYTAVVSARGGGGSIARLRAAIDRVRPEVDQCLRRVAAGKGMRGKLAVKFVITPSGRVRDATIVEDSINRAAARACLTKPIHSAQFPSPPNNRPLEYTLPIAVNVAPVRGGGGSAPVSKGSLRPQKDGPYPAAKITEVMSKRRPVFNACNKRGLRGDVTLRFTIRDSGRVSNVKVRASSLKNAAVEKCMVRVAKKLRFESKAGRKPTRVFYPFSFR